MTWWCAARGTVWSWSWQAYPGVWLFVGLLIWMAWRARQTQPGNAGHNLMAGLSIGAVWVALDWPVGALGAGYLLSAHQLQYVLLVMVAPPLMLRARILPTVGARATAVARWMTRPVQAIIICNAIVVLTHLQPIVDRLMPTQLGSFALDMSWLGAGLILWGPAVHPSAARRLSYPARFGYLLAVTLVPGIPASFFFFANYPLYSLYELAPPIAWMPVMQDQFVGGIIMKFGSFLVILVALSAVFYRWHEADRDEGGAIVLPDPVGGHRAR